MDNEQYIAAIKNIDTVEKATFIFESAKDKLLATIDSFKSQQIKSFLLVLYSIGALLFLFTQFKSNSDKWFYLVQIICQLLIVGLVCIKNLGSSKVADIGGSPKNLMLNANLLQQDLKIIIAGSAWLYQDRIDENTVLVKKMAKVLATGFRMSLLILIAVIIREVFVIFG